MWQLLHLWAGTNFPKNVLLSTSGRQETTLKKKVECPAEISVPIYEIARHHTSADIEVLFFPIGVSIFFETTISIIKIIYINPVKYEQIS